MTDEEAVALVPAIIASLNSQPSMAALHESPHNPFCFLIYDDDAMIDVGKLATDIIAALTALGWQKIEPESAVVAQQFVDEMKLAKKALLSVAADLDKLSERDLAEFARAMIAAATKKPAAAAEGKK